MVTTGRVLKRCTLVYGNNNQQFQAEAKGSWNLRNVQFAVPKGARWAVVICVSPQQMQETRLGTFIQTLRSVASERHMPFNDPVGRDPIYAYEKIEQAKRRPKDGVLEQFLSAEVQRLEAEAGLEKGSIGLLLAVMSDSAGDNGKYLRPALKRWSHTISGIPVQCCQVSKALKTGDRKKMASDPQVRYP